LTAAVRLAGASRVYPSAVALHPTDLVVEEGELLALVGPSGSGKSTLISLVAGLTPPSAGTVEVLGTTLSGTMPAALRHRMGYVIQEGGLFPHLSARENVALLARDLGGSDADVAARVDELGDLVSLDRDQLDRYPGRLSGGQRQRVALMRALMLKPELVLLDEPLGALDPVTRFQLQEDLRRIFQQLGSTMIVVTHDVGEAAFLADRIVIMGEGRVVQQGTMAAIAAAPANDGVATFLSAHRPVPEVGGEVVS
jgi:osmoprotectant transport system ATP-binding protein